MPNSARCPVQLETFPTNSGVKWRLRLGWLHLAPRVGGCKKNDIICFFRTDDGNLVPWTSPCEDTASPQSSTQRVYLALRNEIITGQIPPGERLKIDALKVALDTGASPVREALSLLTSDQLVDRLDQRGFRVAATSRAQFQEILDLRCNLEELALRDSLANADTAWEDALVLGHHHMNKGGPERCRRLRGASQAISHGAARGLQIPDPAALLQPAVRFERALQVSGGTGEILRAPQCRGRTSCHP